MNFFDKDISRRDFIKTGALATGTLLLPFNAFSLSKSDVIEVYSKQVTKGRKINRQVCKKMLEQGIKRLTGTNDARAGLKKIFPGINTRKKISIKINTINSSCPTHPEAVYALCDIITSMQVPGGKFPSNNIIIWDREEEELKNAGYSINTSQRGVKVIANETNGYGFTKAYKVYGVRQQLAKILLEETDYLVNFAVLKHHGLADVTLTMKNHYGSVSDAWQLHAYSCNPYLVELNGLPPIKNTPTLFLVDSIFGLNRGGPRGYPNFRYNSILLSRDTVAIDKRGFDIIKSKGGRISNTEFMRKANRKLGNMNYKLTKLTV